MPVYTNTYKGLFEGTEEIDLVPAPPSGLTIVTMIRVVNTDTEDATPKLRVQDLSKINEEDENLNVASDIVLAASEYMQMDGVVCVLQAHQKLVGYLASNVTTSELQWMTVVAREVY
mgnify:FL=1